MYKAFTKYLQCTQSLLIVKIKQLKLGFNLKLSTRICCYGNLPLDFGLVLTHHTGLCLRAQGDVLWVNSDSGGHSHYWTTPKKRSDNYLSKVLVILMYILRN